MREDLRRSSHRVAQRQLFCNRVRGSAGDRISLAIRRLHRFSRRRVNQFSNPIGSRMERLRPLGVLAICISVIFFIYAILLMTVGSSLTSALIIRAPVFSEGLAKN